MTFKTYHFSTFDGAKAFHFRSYSSFINNMAALARTPKNLEVTT